MSRNIKLRCTSCHHKFQLTWRRYINALFGKHYCPECHQASCFKRKWWFGILSVLAFFLSIIPSAILFQILCHNLVVGIFGGLIVGMAVDKYLIFRAGALSKETQINTILKPILSSTMLTFALSLIFFIFFGALAASFSNGIPAMGVYLAMICAGAFFVMCWPLVWSITEICGVIRQRATVRFWHVRLALAILVLLGLTMPFGYGQYGDILWKLL